MKIRNAVAVVGASALYFSLACGQIYPNKSIRMVTSEAGGGADFSARVIGRELSANLGQQVLIDNRGGAGGVMAGEAVAKAPADGYTILFYGPAIFLLPFLRKHVPYDALKDFQPVTHAVTTPNVVVVHPSLPITSVRALLALAKARPGQLNDAGANTGSSAHLTAELFKAMTGAKIVRIPYKGVGPALNAVIAGHVQVMFLSAGSSGTHIRAGRLRALAVTSLKPSALTPDLPTVSDSGVPGYESVAIFGILAPARTPLALVNRLQSEVARAFSSTDMKARLLQAGVEPVGSTPEEYAATIRSEMDKWGRVIRDAGIRDD